MCIIDVCDIYAVIFFSNADKNEHLLIHIVEVIRIRVRFQYEKRVVLTDTLQVSQLITLYEK